MNGQDVLSVEEAAEFLKLAKEPDAARAKLLKLVRARKIGHTKTGRTVTFRLEALWAYQTANETAPLAPNPHGLSNAAARRIARAS